MANLNEVFPDWNITKEIPQNIVKHKLKPPTKCPKCGSTNLAKTNDGFEMCLCMCGYVLWKHGTPNKPCYCWKCG